MRNGLDVRFPLIADAVGEGDPEPMNPRPTRYTRRQKFLLAMALPFGVTILAVNIASALGASESTKDNIVLADVIAFVLAISWAIWTSVRKR